MMLKKQQKIKTYAINVFQRFKLFIKKPEGLFVVIAGIFGLIFVFLVPPIQVYDERAHFFQSYAFSNLNLIPEKHEYLGKYHYGAELPKSVFVAGELFIANTAGVAETKFDTKLFGYIDQPLEPEITDHREYGSGYSPVVYIPQIIGISIGKAFNTSPLIMIWLGRLANLVVWILLIYAAIRIIPFAKWAVVVLALNPMTVFLSASLSADVITISLAFLFFSVVASTYVARKSISKIKLAVLFGLVSLLALTKPTNILFGFLLFTIPWRLFYAKWKYILFCVGAIGFSLVVAYVWNLLLADANAFNAQNMAIGRLISPNEQLSIILNSPIDYIKILLLNFVIIPDGQGYPGNQVLTSIVESLGWGETKIPLWTTLFYMIMVVFVFLYTAGRGYVLTKLQKSILLALFVLFCVGNITAMYLYFTGVGQSIILGVQGRYFIPGLILVAALFTARKKIITISDKNFKIIIASGLSLVMLVTLLTIVIRYYGI